MPRLPSSILREIGADTLSRGPQRYGKRKFLESRKDRRQTERAVKKARQRGSFTPQGSSQPSRTPFRDTYSSQHFQNVAPKPFSRSRKSPRTSRQDRPQLSQTAIPQPKSKTCHPLGSELPWSDDDSIHSPDFISKPELPKKSQKTQTRAKTNSDKPLGLPWSDDDSIHTSDFDSEPEQPVSKSRKSTKDTKRKAKFSGAVMAQLEQEDEEISRLEKKLGMKKDSKGLPKDFKDDGLADLFGDGSGDESDGVGGLGEQDEEWLRQKRRKALGDQDGSDHSFSDYGEDDESLDGEIEEDEEESFRGFDSGDEESAHEGPPKARENPYIPPNTGRITVAGEQSCKYVPLPLRNKASDADVTLLQKKTKSLVNKVTHATIIPCLNDVKKLYHTNARQLVTETLVDQLLMACSERAQLIDAFIVDVAGFSAAIFKFAGIDFVAHLVRRSYELFSESYEREADGRGVGEGEEEEEEEVVHSKETKNLISLISALYSFEVIGPRLVYDYIRLLLDPRNFTERNTDLLMRIIQVCGPKLRKDDPASLKAVVGMMKPAVERIGPANLSFRTKFVIDDLNDLVNSKKKAVKRHGISSERIVNMKKIVGTIKTAERNPAGPVNLGLEDVENAGTKGMWWRVGARRDGNDGEAKNKDPDMIRLGDDDMSFPPSEAESEVDVNVAAEALGMNNDLRRSIFAAVTTAVDVDDGFRRLNMLGLNARKQKEIPHVLVQCVGAEKDYNMYYSLLARRFCDGHQMQFAFQTALWQVFRGLGESVFDEDAGRGDRDDDEDEEDASREWSGSRIVHTARLFGVLISERLLSLKSLRAINLMQLVEKTKEFLTLVMVAILIPLPEKSDKVYRKLRKGRKTGETEVLERVFEIVEGPILTAGLLKLVKRAEKFEGLEEKDASVLRWAAGVATEILIKRTDE